MKFVIQIASVPDRDRAVAEIWFGEAMVAELHVVPDGTFELDIFARESSGPWFFDLESWLTALVDARSALEAR